jgi:hypothetical protein
MANTGLECTQICPDHRGPDYRGTTVFENWIFLLLLLLCSISILCSITFFPKIRAVYEIMWKNMVEPDRSEMTT